MITNLRYADDIILLATSEAELQELVDHLDRVSRKYSLLINVDKTKVITSDDIACRILIQNEVLDRVARSPVFYGRSRISDPFSRLPGGEPPGRTNLPYSVSQTVASLRRHCDT